jgi:hypothetical protein
MENYSIDKKRIIIAIIASIYFIYYGFSYTEWHFIDNINLIIHEAGHTVFMLFGNFVQLLGGSFLQVMFPLIFVLYFYRERDYFSSSLLLFWVGQNLINVSVYVSDSIVMQLPLLGGESSLHDWNNILSMMGLLEYSEKIGFGIYILGFIIIACAVYYSFYNSISKKDTLFV